MSNTGTSNSSKNEGLLSTLSFGLFGSKNSNMNTKTNTKTNTSRSKNNGVLPVSAGIPNVKTELNASNSPKPNQTGGMAAINFRYPSNMQQPSYEVMRWATTAGVPTPTGSQMRNVAHGGKRRTHKKHRKSHKKHLIVRRKTHRNKSRK